MDSIENKDNYNNNNSANVGNVSTQGTPAIVAVTSAAVLVAVIVGHKIENISEAVVDRIRGY